MQPISIQSVGQALVNSGVITGFRQGLEQTAVNLRKQAAAWRAEARGRTKRVPLTKPLELLRAHRLLAETERWALKLDQLAEALMLEHARRKDEDAQQRHAAEALMGAFDARVRELEGAATSKGFLGLFRGAG